MKPPAREELESIMAEVLSELGVSKGKPSYANAELEELFRDESYRPEETIALNLRMECVDGRGGLRLIRLRLEPEDNRDEAGRRLWIKKAFKERLQCLLMKLATY
jgi:hypothetical protein